MLVESSGRFQRTFFLLLNFRHLQILSKSKKVVFPQVNRVSFKSCLMLKVFTEAATMDSGTGVFP